MRLCARNLAPVLLSAHADLGIFLLSLVPSALSRLGCPQQSLGAPSRPVLSADALFGGTPSGPGVLGADCSRSVALVRALLAGRVAVGHGE